MSGARSPPWQQPPYDAVFDSIRPGNRDEMNLLPRRAEEWLALSVAWLLSAIANEFRLQNKLTCPPLIYGQRHSNDRLKRILEILMSSPSAILRRNIRPSLFVGTRPTISSSAAYMLRGPSSKGRAIFREVLVLPLDGTRIALDWEFTDDAQKKLFCIGNGSLNSPVVLVLHGINNHANFGYIRSLMRKCSNMGWVAVGMNFRGCGGTSLRTPRGYNGAYTGDLRGVVNHISGRLEAGKPLFLVGNSLGANLVAKYLGEEGLSNTLPECVAGGVTLGNPTRINSETINPAMSSLLALGTKSSLLKSWNTLKSMARSPLHASAVAGALNSGTLAQFDNCLAPVCVRNSHIYPHDVRYGYENGKAYWRDASSYRVLPHVSVPLLQVIAGDDFLVYTPFKSKLNSSLSNPNVLVVESRAGGHLGWYEANPNDDGCNYGIGKSWADVLTVDFIDAVMRSGTVSCDVQNDGNSLFSRKDAKREGPRLRSKL